MTETDPIKDLKFIYTTSAQEITSVNFPRWHYGMIDPQSDPDTAPGFHRDGKPHEIYLKGLWPTAPVRRKIIIRHPVTLRACNDSTGI